MQELSALESHAVGHGEYAVLLHDLLYHLPVGLNFLLVHIVFPEGYITDYRRQIPVIQRINLLALKTEVSEALSFRRTSYDAIGILPFALRSLSLRPQNPPCHGATLLRL